MEETAEQREVKFKPGVGGWIVIVVVGLFCAVLLPILLLAIIINACAFGMGPMCFLVGHSWVSGIAAVAAFVGGMFFAYKVGKRSHKRRSEEQPHLPEMTIDQRQHEARMGWLNDHGRHRR